MPIDNDKAGAAKRGWRRQVRRWLPLAVVVALAVAVLLSDARHLLSLETLVRNRDAIAAFIATHRLAAIAIFIAVYMAAVALSLPGAAVLTLAGGFLFGTIPGWLASVTGATAGAVTIFLIACSAFGETLLRRAGPFAAKLADGFRADAFHYLLFLRLVPVFPFWLVNLSAALFAVPLRTFFTATVLGIMPAGLAFSFAGAGLDSVISAQAAAYNACLAAGKAGCRLDFDVRHVLTPKLLGALLALGALSLVPVAVKRWRARIRANHAPH